MIGTRIFESIAASALADFNINLDLSGKPMRDLSKTTSKAIVGYISAMHEYGDDYWFVSNKWETAAAMWIAGIPYDLIHCVSNFVLTLLLYRPLYRVFSHFLSQAKTGQLMEDKRKGGSDNETL